MDHPSVGPNAYTPTERPLAVSVFVTKVLSLFLHPLSLGLVLIVAGLVLSRWWRRIGLVGVIVGVLVLWVPSTPIVAGWLQGTLESRYPPTPIDSVPSADAIVMLGGALKAPQPPRIYPDLNDAADRVWYAARLYRAGKAPLIIASGGTLPWRHPDDREAPVMQTLLSDWGVPPDSVLLEAGSANTYQNATNTAALMADRGFDRVLLVTSALHMRRALATFRSAGVSAIPAATDYQIAKTERTILDIAPDAGALTGSTAAIREYAGYIVYDWRGWIARLRSAADVRDPEPIRDRRSLPDRSSGSNVYARSSRKGTPGPFRHIPHRGEPTWSPIA